MPRHVLCREPSHMGNAWNLRSRVRRGFHHDRLVRKEIGTSLNVIKSLKYIWPSGLVHPLLAGMLQTPH